MLGRFIKGASEQPVATKVESLAVLPVAPALSPTADIESQGDGFLTLKVELHRHLIDRFNLTALESASKDEILNEIRPIVREFVRNRNVPLNARELDQLTSDTADEMLGLGPIEPLLKDDTITDILINTHKRVFIERRGLVEETAIRFRDEAHLLRIINKIVSAIGRRVDDRRRWSMPGMRTARASTSRFVRFPWTARWSRSANSRRIPIRSNA